MSHHVRYVIIINGRLNGPFGPLKAKLLKLRQETSNPACEITDNGLLVQRACGVWLFQLPSGPSQFAFFSFEVAAEAHRTSELSGLCVARV